MILDLMISFFFSLGMLLILIYTPLGKFALDMPNDRSLHTKITPRSGGLAIFIGVLASWFISSQPLYWMSSVLILVAISITDDIKSIGIGWRFFLQILVSTWFVIYILPDISWIIRLVLILAMTWMINLYNFMDGSDGLAGGMAIVGFGSYSVASFMANDIQIAILSASVSSACIAFLIFNFYPAKIFMGDSGSIPLGFLAGSIGLYGVYNHLWAIWFPIIIFSPFIMDATLTLLKRIVKGEKFWRPHRTHYYQRLVQMGLGHRETAICEYIVMFLASILALLLNQLGDLNFIFWVSVFLFFYAVSFLIIDLRWKNT